MSVGHASWTFMNVPASRLAHSRLATLGVPLESGHHPVRSGARHGPEAIRRQSKLMNRFSLEDELDVIESTGLFDAGDVQVTQTDIARSLAAIQKAVEALHNEKQTVITFGGDGIVTLPQLRAVSAKHPNFAVVHIDAHADTNPLEGPIGPTAFTRAVAEKLLDPHKSVHVGLREPVAVGGLRKFVTGLGYTLITMREVRKQGMEEVAAGIKSKAGSSPVYLCYDVDVFEPAMVPGVFTPLCDGALPSEGLELLRCLQGLNFVHFDINNVTPQYDVHGYSALLAAHIAWTCVNMFARGLGV
jgi:arginase family enzyme